MYGKVDKFQCGKWSVPASSILSMLAATVAFPSENTGRRRVVVEDGVRFRKRGCERKGRLERDRYRNGLARPAVTNRSPCVTLRNKVKVPTFL